MESKIINKNGYIIDDPVLSKNYHVLIDENVAYTCTLNQTNVEANNNKFYIMQILENDNAKEYLLYIRYGRIGDDGRKSHDTYSEKYMVINKFCSQFKTKTGNIWGGNFTKKAGKYFMTQIDYGEKPIIKKDENKNIVLSCDLDERIQDLIKRISDINMMNGLMTEFKLDLKKMPLGKISKQQIQKGYDTLKDLSEVIKSNDKDKIVELTSMFYTYIPSSFGRRKPPLINTDEQIKQYSDILSVLTDLEIAGNILNDANNNDIHPINKIYRQLNIDIIPIQLDKDSGEYQMILDYVNNTHGSTHSSYRLELLDVMKVKRQEEYERYKDYGNKMLLFHGSRTANFMGILSKGLRINNNAPKTGSMFGPGSYFANSVSKSANYCYVNNNDIGYMLLCEVSLGNMYETYHSEYITHLPNDKYQSTRGIGESIPDPKIKNYLDGDILIPNGKLIKSGKRESLLYDEFIVYRENQIKLRYIMKLKFNYR